MLTVVGCSALCAEWSPKFIEMHRETARQTQRKSGEQESQRVSELIFVSQFRCVVLICLRRGTIILLSMFLGFHTRAMCPIVKIFPSTNEAKLAVSDRCKRALNIIQRGQPCSRLRLCLLYISVIDGKRSCASPYRGEWMRALSWLSVHVESVELMFYLSVTSSEYIHIQHKKPKPKIYRRGRINNQNEE